MRSLAAVVMLVAAGCAGGAPYYEAPMSMPVQTCYQNPVFVAGPNHDRLWETLVDVVDDYFKIEREEPVRQIGGVLTEGRLDTYPEVGATLFEPWHCDSVGPEERLESTLQSIRRYAQVKVTPDRGGYWVNVTVFKELEDVMRPAHSSAGAATFRNDGSLTRVTDPIKDQDIHEGWIPQGRDAPLENQILADLQSRLTPVPRSTMPPPAY